MAVIRLRVRRGTAILRNCYALITDHTISPVSEVDETHGLRCDLHLVRDGVQTFQGVGGEARQQVDLSAFSTVILSSSTGYGDESLPCGYRSRIYNRLAA
jgi:hypothetical protein